MDLLDKIKEKTGMNPFSCTSCGKCSAGCPVVSFMDYKPNQAIRLIQLGYYSLLLKSKTIWLCLSCKTCSARCPRNIELSSIMNSLIHISYEEKIKPCCPDILLFHKIFTYLVKNKGRLSELLLILMFNLASKKPFNDVVPGIAMLIKGKVKL